VTESTARHDVKRVAKQMAVLTEQDIKFSIDDFGTGHSSLGRLHNLPISTLKIDRSFVDLLSVQGGTFSIVQAIISMAHALGHEVVAEGVETADQLAILRRLHCDFLQGFLLSRPAAPCRIPALITAGHAAITQFDSGNPAMGPERSEPEGFMQYGGVAIR
jgi:EAL domain-containing protein (putative c-di-GMP-specific phosphodiesterase class I)